MPEFISVPAYGEAITEQGIATLELHNWIVSITDAVNNIPPLTGTGSPEGVVVGSVGRWYVDIAAAVGTGIYQKETGDGNTGWILRS